MIESMKEKAFEVALTNRLGEINDKVMGNYNVTSKNVWGKEVILPYEDGIEEKHQLEDWIVKCDLTDISYDVDNLDLAVEKIINTLGKFMRYKTDGMDLNRFTIYSLTPGWMFLDNEDEKIISHGIVTFVMYAYIAYNRNSNHKIIDRMSTRLFDLEGKEIFEGSEVVPVWCAPCTDLKNYDGFDEEKKGKVCYVAGQFIIRPEYGMPIPLCNLVPFESVDYLPNIGEIFEPEGFTCYCKVIKQ